MLANVMDESWMIMRSKHGPNSRFPVAHGDAMPGSAPVWHDGGYVNEDSVLERIGVPEVVPW